MPGRGCGRDLAGRYSSGSWPPDSSATRGIWWAETVGRQRGGLRRHHHCSRGGSRSVGRRPRCCRVASTGRCVRGALPASRGVGLEHDPREWPGRRRCRRRGVRRVAAGAGGLRSGRPVRVRRRGAPGEQRPRSVVKVVGRRCRRPRRSAAGRRYVSSTGLGVRRTRSGLSTRCCRRATGTAAGLPCVRTHGRSQGDRRWWVVGRADLVDVRSLGPLENGGVGSAGRWVAGNDDADHAVRRAGRETEAGNIAGYRRSFGTRRCGAAQSHHLDDPCSLVPGERGAVDRGAARRSDASGDGDGLRRTSTCVDGLAPGLGQGGRCVGRRRGGRRREAGDLCARRGGGERRAVHGDRLGGSDEGHVVLPAEPPGLGGQVPRDARKTFGCLGSGRKRVELAHGLNDQRGERRRARGDRLRARSRARSGLRSTRDGRSRRRYGFGCHRRGRRRPVPAGDGSATAASRRQEPADDHRRDHGGTRTTSTRTDRAGQHE